MRFVWVFFCVLVAGCSDPAGPAQVAGRYDLRIVNGQELPFVLTQTPFEKLEVLSDYYQLNSDQSYTTTSTYRHTKDATVRTYTESGLGVWGQSGNTVIFTPAAGQTISAALSGATLTFVFNGVSTVYRRH